MLHRFFRLLPGLEELPGALLNLRKTLRLVALEAGHQEVTEEMMITIPNFAVSLDARQKQVAGFDLINPIPRVRLPPDCIAQGCCELAEDGRITQKLAQLSRQAIEDFARE